MKDLSELHEEIYQLRSLSESYNIQAYRSFVSGVCLLLLLGMLRFMNSPTPLLVWGISVAIVGCILYYIYAKLQDDKYSNKVYHIHGLKYTNYPMNDKERTYAKHAKEGFRNWKGSPYYEKYGPYCVDDDGSYICVTPHWLSL